MGSAGLPSLNQAQMLKALARLGHMPMVGANGKQRGKGSHVLVRGPSGRPVPIQDANLPPTFVGTILRQLGVDVQEFLDACNKRAG